MCFCYLQFQLAFYLQLISHPLQLVANYNLLFVIILMLLPKNSRKKVNNILNSTVMTDNNFKSRDIGLRAQKKILSRMATKNIAKTFIDGTTASLLDNLYKLCKMHVSHLHSFNVLILIFEFFADW